MIRVAVTAGMLVIALAFIDSARSDEVPLLNIHSDNFEAIAGWQSGEAQVNFTATDYASTNLSEDQPPPHQISSAVAVCVELPTRTICSSSSLLDDQFLVNGNLDSTVVNAVVPAQECLRVAPFTCSDSSLHIDLAWTATGALDRSDRFHNKIFSPEPCHINELGAVSRRQAQVTGSLTDGTMDFIAGLDTVYAEIIRFHSATTGRGDAEQCL